MDMYCVIVLDESVCWPTWTVE